VAGMADIGSKEIQPFQLTEHNFSGRFIAVEGMNGCGVTALVRKICRDLESKGYDVLRARLPSDRLRKSSMFKTFSQMNRRSEIDPLVFEVAYMADKLQTSQHVIAPALAQGKIVVADRYLFSSLGALLIRAPELAAVVKDAIYTRDWFRDLVENMVKPDVSIYLSASADIAVDRILRRQQERSFEIEENAYQQLLDDGIALARLNGMQVFDTTATSVNETFKNVLPFLDKTLTW